MSIYQILLKNNLKIENMFPRVRMIISNIFCEGLWSMIFMSGRCFQNLIKSLVNTWKFNLLNIKKKIKTNFFNVINIIFLMPGCVWLFVIYYIEAYNLWFRNIHRHSFSKNIFHKCLWLMIFLICGNIVKRDIFFRI